MSLAEIINLPTADRPVLPEWATNRRLRRITARWARSHVTHVASYHAVRTPLYASRLASYAPIGFGRSVLGAARWASDWDSRQMRQSIISTHDASHFVSAEKMHSDRVRFRASVAGIGACAATGVAMSVGFWGSGLEQAGLSAAALGGFGFVGRPRGTKLVDSAHVPVQAQRISADFVAEALCSLGISNMRDAEQIPTPLVQRDGQGWRADVDLPAGITAAQVMAKRENLAGAMGRPLGSVWPECDTAISPGRLVLWVGDHDLASMPQGQWPMASVARADIFKPFPFGENAKGDLIDLCLAETNMLIGAIPGAGKTTSLREVVLAAVLDARTELWLWEFKGTGDFDALLPVCTRFGSGPDDENVKSALAGLKELRAECARRATLIKQLGDEAPEHKVTSELANRAGLHPLVVALDEVQELFRHSVYGKEAGELAEQIIKLGRALGVILLLATQRPDRDSLPTGISANVGTRFCLRVKDQISNDMILGTSAHARGIKANTLTPRERGVGYLDGQHDEAQIVRVFNLDQETTKAIVERAVSLRGGAVAVANPDPKGATTTALHVLAERASTDLLLDILDVADEDMWTADLAALLDVDPETMKRELRQAGVETQQVFRRVDGRAVNRKGIRLNDVRRALEVAR